MSATDRRIGRFDRLQPMSTAKDLGWVPQGAMDIVYARKLMPVILDDTKNPFGNVAPIFGAAGMTMTLAVCPPGQGPGLHAHRCTYETFTVLSGVVQPDILGNRNLRPAYSTEWDVGFNLDVLSRFSLEYSYARKTTRDQILLAPVNSISGYRAQWKNAGTLAGRSHEVSLQALLVDTRAWHWRRWRFSRWSSAGTTS